MHKKIETPIFTTQYLLENINPQHRLLKTLIAKQFLIEGAGIKQFVQDALRDLQLEGVFLFTLKEKQTLSNDQAMQETKDRILKRCNGNHYLVDAMCQAHSQDSGHIIFQLLNMFEPFKIHLICSGSISQNNYTIKNNKIYLERHYSPIPFKNEIGSSIVGYTAPITLKYIVKEPDLYVVTNGVQEFKGNAIQIELSSEGANIYITENAKLLIEPLTITLSDKEKAVLLSGNQFSIEKIEDDQKIAILRGIIQKVRDLRPDVQLFACLLESIHSECKFLAHVLADNPVDESHISLLQTSNMDYFLNRDLLKQLFLETFQNKMPAEVTREQLDEIFIQATVNFHKQLNLSETREYLKKIEQSSPAEYKKYQDKYNELMQLLTEVQNEVFNCSPLILEEYFLAEFISVLTDPELLDITIKDMGTIKKEGQSICLSACSPDYFNEKGEKNDSHADAHKLTFDLNYAFTQGNQMNLRDKILFDAAFENAYERLWSNILKKLGQEVKDAEAAYKLNKNDETKTKYNIKLEEFNKFNEILINLPYRIMESLNGSRHQKCREALASAVIFFEKKFIKREDAAIKQEDHIVSKAFESGGLKLQAKCQETNIKAPLENLKNMREIPGLHNVITKAESLLLTLNKQESMQLDNFLKIVNDYCHKEIGPDVLYKALQELTGKRDWVKIISLAILAMIALTLMAFCIMLAIHTAGISTPLSLIGLKVGFDLLLCVVAVIGIAMGAVGTAGFGFFGYSSSKQGTFEMLEEDINILSPKS